MYLREMWYTLFHPMKSFFSDFNTRFFLYFVTGSISTALNFSILVLATESTNLQYPSHEAFEIPLSGLGNQLPNVSIEEVPLRVLGLQVTGMIDTYFSYNFNRPQSVIPQNSNSAQSTMIPSPQNNLHLYDWYHNQLGLNLIEISVSQNRKQTEFLLDLDFGQSTDILSQAPILSDIGGPLSGTVDETFKHIGQMTLTYKPVFLPGLFIRIGKMNSHIGLEKTKAKENWNYTRSTLYSFGVPKWHTGFHLGYILLPERLTTNLFFYQGWNTIYDYNAFPSLGTQVRWTASPNLIITYNYLAGPEQFRDPFHWRQLHDANVRLQIVPSLEVAGDFLYAKEAKAPLTLERKDVTWKGYELLARWRFFNDIWLCPRLEVYLDNDGYTLGGGSQSLTTYTLTTGLEIAPDLELRMEFRHDNSSVLERFITTENKSDKQNTLLMSAIYTL